MRDTFAASSDGSILDLNPLAVLLSISRTISIVFSMRLGVGGLIVVHVIAEPGLTVSRLHRER